MIPWGHYLSFCYRKADIRDFDWVWPFETSKWDFNLSSIGFFFFFLLQIWFLWKWGINTTEPDSMQINPCQHSLLKHLTPVTPYNQRTAVTPLFSTSSVEVGDRVVRGAAVTEVPVPGDVQEGEPRRRSAEERWWDEGMRKDRAEHGYGAQSWEHTGGTLGFSITQINPLTLFLVTSTSQQKTEWRISRIS